MQQFYGIPVAVDNPEDTQFTRHILQCRLHDFAITVRAGLGTGCRIDDDGVFREFLHHVEKIRPAVSIIETVHAAMQIGQLQRAVRLVDIRIVGVRIHQQDVGFPVEQVVHQRKGKKAFAHAALAAANIKDTVLNSHCYNSESGMSGV